MKKHHVLVTTLLAALVISGIGFTPNETVIVDAASGLNMRNDPAVNARIVALIPNGSSVTVLEEKDPIIDIQGIQGRWTKISWNGKTGWVFGGFLKPASADSGSPEKGYRIGDRGPAGGWIFYDKGNDSDGWRYLEAAREDVKASAWGCRGSWMTGADRTDFGTGKANTLAIIKGCGEAKTAARAAAAYRGGGKNDWFLPSRNELSELYDTLAKKRIGNLNGGFYWSSSDKDANNAYGWCFQDGYGGYGGGYAKNEDLKIRPVRAF